MVRHHDIVVILISQKVIKKIKLSNKNETIKMLHNTFIFLSDHDYMRYVILDHTRITQSLLTSVPSLPTFPHLMAFV